MAETDDEIFRLISKGFSPVTRAGFGAHFAATIPCSDSAKDLIARLLNSDTASRLTAAEALEHPWLTGQTASDKPILSHVLHSLKQFQAKQKFKISVLNMMSSTLTDDEIAQLKETFRAIDENGDGGTERDTQHSHNACATHVLCADEMCHVSWLSACLFAFLLRCGRGDTAVVTLQELKKAVAKGDAGLVASADEIERLMKIADLDGDGVLSYEEVWAAEAAHNLFGRAN